MAGIPTKFNENKEWMEDVIDNHDMCQVLWQTPPTLEEAQEIVGGYVEMVELNDLNLFFHYDTSLIQLLVDEEGLLKGLPVNNLASRLSGRTIVGSALFLVEGALWK